MKCPGSHVASGGGPSGQLSSSLLPASLSVYVCVCMSWQGAGVGAHGARMHPCGPLFLK